MAIPDFQTLMLPLLRYCADGKEHSKRDAVPSVSTSAIYEIKRIDSDYFTED